MFAKRAQGAVEVITPQVPLKSEHVAEFHDTVEHCLENGVPMLVLDLHEVPLADSEGLESLLDVRERIAERRGAVKLAGLTPLMADILKITGVGEQFEIFDDAKAAVRSFVQ